MWNVGCQQLFLNYSWHTQRHNNNEDQTRYIIFIHRVFNFQNSRTSTTEALWFVCVWVCECVNKDTQWERRRHIVRYRGDFKNWGGGGFDRREDVITIEMVSGVWSEHTHPRCVLELFCCPCGASQNTRVGIVISRSRQQGLQTIESR